MPAAVLVDPPVRRRAEPPPAPERLPASPPTPRPVSEAFPEFADPTDAVVLRGVSWETYLALADAPENRRTRFTYDGTDSAEGGVLEIEMPPEFRHENVSRLLFHLVVIFLTARGIDWEPAGAVHVRRPRRRGGMPDESFYLAPASIAAVRAALSEAEEHADDREPVAAAAPDLALEIVFGNPLSDRKRAAFAEAGIPEVWVWQNGALGVLALVDAPDPAERTFADAPESRLLPDFPLAVAVDLLARRGDLGAPGVLREFAAALAAASAA